MEAKTTLRYRARRLREALSYDTRMAMDRQVLRLCQSEIDWQIYRRVMIFLPIERLREIDTWPLVLWIWKKPRTKLYVPQIIGGTIQAVQITSQSTFVTNKWGIPEPADGAVRLERERLDLIIVPLLGFDSRGHRVGYGHGYFDKFFLTHRYATLIGLGYESLFVPTEIANEPHDVPLQSVITEQRIHRFTQ